MIDGSGSMREWMDSMPKFELAKRIVGKYLDSLLSINSNVETAVRVFGHQHPPLARNCEDSRLEVPFGKNSSASIQAVLSRITPQGWTAIAYALEKAANDFPPDPSAKNVIVLISDGIETCGGDVCAVGAAFQQRKIFLKPHIIGLNLPRDKLNFFDCAGKFYDVTNITSFDNAMHTAITQSLNPTTAQINLLNQFGKPVETNIEVSLYDSYSGKVLYNFVHALNERGLPDTLILNPAGKYDLIVHSVPPVMKKEIELVAGTHNIIAVDVPQGILRLTESGTFKRTTPLQCVVRRKGESGILIVQDFNTARRYLTGTYHLEILTLPRIVQEIEIVQGIEKEIIVESPGVLSLSTMSGGIASIYVQKGTDLERVYEFKKIQSRQVLLLQPGKYMLVYRLNNRRTSADTRTMDFEIISGQTKTLNL